MQQIKLNDTLQMDVPEGFRVMTEEEVGQLNILEKGPGVCLSDAQRHIMVSVGWKALGGFVSFLLKTGDLAVNAEKVTRKAMLPYGYKLQGSVKRKIAGHPAAGYRYTYTAQETGMTGQTLVLKLNKTVYYFNFYARTALEQESLPVWEEILDRIV